jgi:superfamily II DNA or RNA helicase
MREIKTLLVTAIHFLFLAAHALVVAHLTFLVGIHFSAKSLVFSQFTSSLRYLQEELPKHGLTSRTLSGNMTMNQRAKALSDFQKDSPTTIFLLSMRAGAVGINLTQANRVFLLEPCLNPALEAQSIGRVYRLVRLWKRGSSTIMIVGWRLISRGFDNAEAKKERRGCAPPYEGYSRNTYVQDAEAKVR